jgi:pyruvate/2-oxoacid:ferredoxin oxidoreductase alpha subunit
MPGNEIEIPKELREFMLDDAEETSLGQKNGAYKQYRYGNLHIREYDDKFLVHTDRIDPRKNPVGHLVYDAPEVLIGLACAVFGGSQVVKKLLNKKSKKSAFASGLVSSIFFGYLGYAATQKIKNYLE